MIVEPSAKVLMAMIDAAKEMEQNAIKAIMTDCVYNAIFQQKLMLSMFQFLRLVCSRFLLYI
ncbi:hypothetical protein QUF54_04960 [Candidatus Marithioploca araucensis]|uniref:Uncharacterized protein n=1 Tax=Candidatus Marithioploca araucensis TaxID=70273 RepID=A0ABT7VSY8_9GAMM|nr:hypothetical protein [Candidatus Marithioploca araucensis]